MYFEFHTYQYHKPHQFNIYYHFHLYRYLLYKIYRFGLYLQKSDIHQYYKIALLPEKYAEYIIVHELCHLKEFNHGRKFWQLVEKAIPGYQDRIEGMKSL